MKCQPEQALRVAKYPASALCQETLDSIQNNLLCRKWRE